MSLNYVRVSNKKSICWIDGLSESKESCDATLIIMFDVSASMGQFVQHFWTALRGIIPGTTYNKIEIITFGERACRFTTTPSNISRWNLPNKEGSTQMRDATNMVFDILDKSNAGLFQFLIISDGELHDLEKNSNSWVRPSSYVIDIINSTSPNKFAKHTIQVAGIRLGNEGSTRAMTCFFKYHNHTAEPVLQDITHSPDMVQVGIISIFHMFKENLVNDFHSISTDGGHALQTDPMSPASNILRVRNGSWFVSNTNPHRLRIDNVSITYIDHENITEAQILPFLKILEFKTKNFKILGNTNVLKDMESFLTQIDSKIKSPENEISNSHIRGKIREIRRDALKSQKSILTRIRTLLNTDNVNRLNAQQQANFLRQVSDNKNARRLVRRNGDVDIHAEIISSMDVNPPQNQTDSDRDEFISFMSVSTTMEILQESFEELQVVAGDARTMDIMSPEQLLQVVGGVGICFQGPVGDFPDPWTYRVDRVFPDIMLGQHEVWEAVEQGNPQILNQHPTIRGTKDAAITGVDVIAHTDADRFYLTKMRRVNRIHNSIAMRRVMALIPNDDIALKTAVIHRQLLDVIEHPTELNSKKCWLNIETLRIMVSPNTLGEFGTSMRSEHTTNNPRFARFWTGDLDVSSCLKPICWMIVNGDSTYASSELDMFNLDLYHTVRGVIACHDVNNNPLQYRNDIISKILGICSENKTRPQSPGTPEPETLNFYDNYSNETITKALASVNASVIFTKNHNTYRALKAVFESTDVQTFQANILASTESPCDDLFLAASVLQALTHSKLSDRVQNHQLLTEDFNTIDDCDKFIKNMVKNQYETEYKKMLGAKIKREEEMRVELAIETLVYAPNIESFIQTLNKEIPDRSSPGYVELLNEMCVPNMPIRFEKLWVLAFGRSTEFDPDLHDTKDSSWIVWNLGNVMSRDDLPRAQEIIAMRNELGDFQFSWDDFKDSYRRMGYIPHVYRVSDKPNRHDHCNSNPYIPEDYRV